MHTKQNTGSPVHEELRAYRQISTSADIVFTSAVVAMGLFAGLFYTFTTAVMPGLTAAEDRTLVDAMQRLIDNPVFPLTILGAGVLLAVTLVQARRAGEFRYARWIVASLACYMVTVIITFVVHLPLNDDLMNAGDPARIENLTKVHDDFATPWIAWDFIRTLASTAAFACLAWASVLRGRPDARLPSRHGSEHPVHR
jgi:uncharacterized membrane protein